MTNSFFDTYTPLARNSLARGEAINAIVDAIIVGFDRVPSAASNQQDRITYCTDTGAANAYVIAPSTPIVSYVEGQRFSFKAVNANTMASTVNVSGLGVKAVKRYDASDLQSGDILAGQILILVYDGTNFQLVTASGGIIAAAAASATAAASSASSASSSASSASSSASAAATSASAASSSATAAASSATAAGSSATSASTSATSAAASLTSVNAALALVRQVNSKLNVSGANNLYRFTQPASVGNVIKIRMWAYNDDVQRDYACEYSEWIVKVRDSAASNLSAATRLLQNQDSINSGVIAITAALSVSLSGGNLTIAVTPTITGSGGATQANIYTEAECMGPNASTPITVL